jgi:hypothetical protein
MLLSAASRVPTAGEREGLEIGLKVLDVPPRNTSLTAKPSMVLGWEHTDSAPLRTEPVRRERYRLVDGGLYTRQLRP